MLWWNPMWWSLQFLPFLRCETPWLKKLAGSFPLCIHIWEQGPRSSNRSDTHQLQPCRVQWERSQEGSDQNLFSLPTNVYSPTLPKMMVASWGGAEDSEIHPFPLLPVYLFPWLFNSTRPWENRYEERRTKKKQGDSYRLIWIGAVYIQSPAEYRVKWILQWDTSPISCPCPSSLMSTIAGCKKHPPNPHQPPANLDEYKITATKTSIFWVLTMIVGIPALSSILFKNLFKKLF